jgi:CheY-like chemotaxis protein
MIDILVIEPSVSVRKTLERLLESHGYTMRGVTRGADAVRQISRQRPDLILSEVQLPDADAPDTGGLELCQQFSLAGLPVILMTTWIDERLRQDSRDAGALDLLSKPLAENLLLSRLAHHLKLPAPVLPQQVQASPTLLTTLMTRPGLLGAALIGQEGEALEQIGAAIPAGLYQPFVSPLPVHPAPVHPGSTATAAGQAQACSLQAESERLPELQCAQLEYLGQCLLLFRLPGDQPRSEVALPASTLVCLIQNSSYASLIKYHLKSSPYVRL